MIEIIRHLLHYTQLLLGSERDIAYPGQSRNVFAVRPVYRLCNHQPRRIDSRMCKWRRCLVFLPVYVVATHENYGAASLDLSTPTGHASTGPTGSIILRLQSSDLFATAETVLDETDQGVQQSGIVHSEAVYNTVNTVNDLSAEAERGSELYKAMKELLSRLEVFKSVIDAVSEVR